MNGMGILIFSQPCGISRSCARIEIVGSGTWPMVGPFLNRLMIQMCLNSQPLLRHVERITGCQHLRNRRHLKSIHALRSICLQEKKNFLRSPIRFRCGGIHEVGFGYAHHRHIRISIQVSSHMIGLSSSKMLMVMEKQIHQKCLPMIFMFHCLLSLGMAVCMSQNNQT